MEVGLFTGVNAKYRRVLEQIEYLTAVERAFWLECQPTFDVTPEPKTGRRFAKVKVTEPIPETYIVVVGEVIYQMRSILDQMMIIMARMSNISKGHLSTIYFPSGQDEAGLQLDACGESDADFEQRRLSKPNAKRRVGKIERFDPDLIDLVLQARAYAGGNQYLYAIMPMAKIDKHMDPIPAANTGQLKGIQNVGVRNAINALMFGGGSYNLRDGVPFSELGPHGQIFPLNDRFQIDVEGRIMFADAPPMSARPILLTLTGMAEALKGFLDAAVEHCQKTGRLG